MKALALIEAALAAPCNTRKEEVDASWNEFEATPHANKYRRGNGNSIISLSSVATCSSLVSPSSTAPSSTATPPPPLRRQVRARVGLSILIKQNPHHQHPLPLPSHVSIMVLMKIITMVLMEIITIIIAGVIVVVTQSATLQSRLLNMISLLHCAQLLFVFLLPLHHQQPLPLPSRVLIMVLVIITTIERVIVVT